MGESKKNMTTFSSKNIFLNDDISKETINNIATNPEHIIHHIMNGLWYKNKIPVIHTVRKI
jgi:hypothetical protein